MSNFVYLATSRARVVYVGITNDPVRRQQGRHGHGDRFHLHVLNRGLPLSRIEVRAVEQFFINGLRGIGQNIANSISVNHPYYAAAMVFGHRFARWVRETFGAALRP